MRTKRDYEIILQNCKWLYTQKELENMSDNTFLTLKNKFKYYEYQKKEEYESPLKKQAVELCIEEFKEKNFWKFNSKRDTDFIIKKMRELQGINQKFNLNISNMRVN